MLVCFKICLVIFIAVGITQCVSEINKRYVNDIGSAQDVPLKTDLHGYLKSLRRTIKYCSKRKNDIDINLAFGLFLIHVNLKSCLKTNILPIALKKELNNLLEDNDKLFQYFKKRNLNTTDPDIMKINNIITMMKEISWVDHLQRFRPVRVLTPLFEPGSHVGKNDPDWKDYLNKMLDFERWTPSPEISTFCIASLVVNPVKTPELKCEISKICDHMLKNGTNFGYAITHRFLFLLHARSGRGCSVYSPKMDRRIRQEFCRRAYEEAEYIAIHDYDYIDLLLEQIALCTLDGHSEFLHRSWLARLLRHQAPHGCFGEYPQRVQNRPNVFKLEHSDEDDCNNHVTGVAAATLGAAVRFIIEIYY
ncbi:hypothetical protein O3G_MSEX013741 [Manduca sexta]|uniref:Uncharacterized protein n=1 Tax=Manduca sexta TaxID=7130 RepID=A0A921ZSP2_MANSE|nr:hypothetical protein O3G_MSEX013741 [Manduca sexta]KAG6463217.1 hypothetical protein O3G_MSEX013741 [Manduca sexta]